MYSILDSGCNHSALYCGASELKWHATAAVLRQWRRLCEHCGSCFQKHCAAGEWNYYSFYEIFLPKMASFQWGEMPTSVAYIGTGQIMGWGNKAIEVSPTQDPVQKRYYNANYYRYVPSKAATWTACSCTRRRSAWNSFASAMTKYSSAVPKVLHRVKSTSWRSTSRAWPTGKADLLSWGWTNRRTKRNPFSSYFTQKTKKNTNESI